jgi:hypothetical protein
MVLIVNISPNNLSLPMLIYIDLHPFSCFPWVSNIHISRLWITIRAWYSLLSQGQIRIFDIWWDRKIIMCLSNFHMIKSTL